MNGRRRLLVSGWTSLRVYGSTLTVQIFTLCRLFFHSCSQHPTTTCNGTGESRSEGLFAQQIPEPGNFVADTLQFADL
jgi:hypothetical protein